MTFWRSFFVAASLLAAPLSLAHAQTPQTVKAKNVVLVHGAWADGSSWSEVDPDPPGRRAQRNRRAESAVVACGFRRSHQARAGRTGWSDRAGRAFLGRHRDQPGRHRPEGYRPRLCRRTCARCQRGFRRAVEAIPDRPRACRHHRARRLHKTLGRRLPEVFRQWREAGAGQGALRRAMADRRLDLRRSHHRGGMALQAELVRGVEERLHHQSRSRTLSSPSA
ncbi:hypothetical protein ACVWZW_007339 [Bradyrhizobium sp. F1.13.4]